jgi:hypothetical protein
VEHCVSHYARKRDASEPAIVDAIEQAGWEVHRELPVDLLCLKRIRGQVVIRLLENKTPATKAGKARKRKDQEEQDAFCKRWDVPKPTTPFEALLAVGEKVEIP